MTKNSGYTYTGSGTNSQVSRLPTSAVPIGFNVAVNSQGNHYCTRESSDSGNHGYHYSNTDGSYYYSNPNGSTYYNSGSGYSQYTSPSGQTSKSTGK